MVNNQLDRWQTLGISIKALIGIIFLLVTANLCFAAESKCLANEPITIVLRNDDVSVATNPQWERRFLNLFVKYQIPQSVGFIPQMSNHINHSTNAKYHSIDKAPEVVELYKPLIKTGLIDPVQHGLTHQSNHLHAGKDLTPSELSEFSGLSLEIQKKKIQTGKETLEKVLEYPVKVFIPPWNNLDDNTISALRQLGFVGVSEDSLYEIDQVTNEVPLAQPTKHLSQLPKLLQEWQQDGKCQGNLDPGIYVFLYHSWEEKSDEGFNRMSSLLDLIQESGVKTSTLSAIFGK